MVIKEFPGSTYQELINYILPTEIYKDLKEYIDGNNRVYFYKNKITNKKVAIKGLKIPDINRDLFIQTTKGEFITLLYCLNKEYVVPSISLGINSQFIGLLMEYGGIPLNKYWIGNKLTEKLFIDGFLQLAKGLEYLHAQNIYHGDIKPQNILIIEREKEDEGLAEITKSIQDLINQGNIVVQSIIHNEYNMTNPPNPQQLLFRYIDFGASIHFDTIEQFLATVRTGRMGRIKEMTEAYIAPEVLWSLLNQIKEGQGHGTNIYTNKNIYTANHPKKYEIKYSRIDIYSLSITMYSLLMGRFLTHGEKVLKNSEERYPEFIEDIEESIRGKMLKMGFTYVEELVDILLRCMKADQYARIGLEELILELTLLFQLYDG